MGGIKCLACGEVNAAEDESCRSCSSSLNLKLCAACEAMNHAQATQCYRCGTALDVQQAVAASPTVPALLHADPAQEMNLPEATESRDYRPSSHRPSSQPAGRRMRRRMIVGALALGGIGCLAVFMYATLQSASAGASNARILPQTEAPAVAGRIHLPERPQVKAVTVTKAQTPKKTEAVAKAQTSAEPRTDPAAPRTEPAAQLESKSLPPRAKPIENGVNETAGAKPARSVTAGPARVTHTKPGITGPTATAVPLTAPAVVKAQPQAPRPADCADAIAALGLCSAVSRGKGN